MSDLEKVLMLSRVYLRNKTKHECRREAHNRSGGVPKLLLYVRGGRPEVPVRIVPLLCLTHKDHFYINSIIKRSLCFRTC